MLSELWGFVYPATDKDDMPQCQPSNLSKLLKHALSQRCEQTHGNWLSPGSKLSYVECGPEGNPCFGL